MARVKVLVCPGCGRLTKHLGAVECWSCDASLTGATTTRVQARFVRSGRPLPARGAARFGSELARGRRRAR